MTEGRAEPTCSRNRGLDTNQLSVEGKAELRRQCATAPDLSLYL